MDVYLIRHAEAVSVKDGDGLTDEQRPLTDAGREQCRVLAATLQAHHLQFDRFVTSPLLRAQQTAEAMLEHWPAPAPELLTCNALAPGGKSRKLTRFLLGLGVESAALVGHMPDLADYAGWLIGGKKAQIALAKTGVACISCPGAPDKGAGELVWLLTPAWYESEKNQADHKAARA
jgi:phosphohistidine phosphatase